jgi:tRNA(adenine34) deaminase
MTMKSSDEIRAELAGYQVNDAYCHDRLAVRCCQLALKSLEAGCYGVGALLTDKNGTILAEAGNEVFLNGFHSARHAEMVVIDLFEERYPDFADRSGLTLMVSLEPCPMCLVRSLVAGIGTVVYIAADVDGGMVERIDRMPPAWINLATLQERTKAVTSRHTASLALALATCSLKELRQQLLASIRK